MENGRNLTEFFNCSLALWRLIHIALKPEDYKEKTGLGILSKLVWVIINKPDLSQAVTIPMLRQLDVWFMKEWQKAKGDFDVIKKEAKKAIKDDAQGLKDLFGGQDAQGTLASAISMASTNTSGDVEEIISPKFIEEGALMEQKLKETSMKLEEEDIDESHESMEYIEPSSLTINTDETIPVDLTIKAGELEEDPVYKIQQCKFRSNQSFTSTNILSVASLSNSPESAAASELTSHLTVTSHPLPPTHCKVSKNNMPPLTPPMTYDDMSSHTQATADLETIHTSPSPFKSILETINRSMLGTSNDFPYETELITEANDAKLVLVVSYLGKWLKEAQQQISNLDTELKNLDLKLDNMHSQNAGLGSKLVDMQQRVVLANIKGAEIEESVRDVRRDVTELKMLMLGELRDVKAGNEKLVGTQEEMMNMLGELERETGMWYGRVRELEEAVEEGDQEGALTEVLWPQGYEVTRRGEKVDGQGSKKIVATKELYVKIGNEAGRGQGGGGFCGVM